MSKLPRVYRDCATKAVRNLISNWPILPGIIVSFIIFQIVASAVAPLGIAGDFLIGMIFVALLSLYYSWIRRTIDRERINFKNILEFDSGLFFQVMSIAFIFWIVLSLLLDSVSQASGDPTASLVAQLAAFLLFNAIPEVLYQQRNEGMEALVDCFNFIKENWIEWFIPLIIVLGPPLLIIPGEYIIAALATSQPLLPFSIILTTWPFHFFTSAVGSVGAILDQLVPLILCHWFMLFRGYLFEAIQHGRTR